MHLRSLLFDSALFTFYFTIHLSFESLEHGSSLFCHESRELEQDYTSVRRTKSSNHLPIHGFRFVERIS